MNAIIVTNKDAGLAGMKLVEAPQPSPAINDVIVQVFAASITGDELSWPSTWTDRAGVDRTPSIPGHELAGVVTALGYGTTGLFVGQRVFGLQDWYRNGSLAEYVAIEARNLAPLPDDADFNDGNALVMPGLTAWQGLFDHGQLQAGQRALVHGAAGIVGSMAVQLARDAGAHVVGTGRSNHREEALGFGANEFIDLEREALENISQVDLVFDVIGGDVAKRSLALIRPGGKFITIAGPIEEQARGVQNIDFVVEADRSQLIEIVKRLREGRLKTNAGSVVTLEDAVATYNSAGQLKGKTIVRVRQ
ncbi:NADP-dependent oxidoreductase [Mucilaginibacter sp. BT774]|uniref:NADP-dependent oxidoreductase n=1 Tax=Mucilaginibacter sp. BT774 TaxID=3062276 RepID=UPI0026751380|nr:NADP-dependent oxidoreductase [Mucilaginibacter sp. BT774]MDO3627468.1 NADP-dependent oxidoreductase [Mucilaginibacter sp. BT774]